MIDGQERELVFELVFIFVCGRKLQYRDGGLVRAFCTIDEVRVKYQYAEAPPFELSCRVDQIEYILKCDVIRLDYEKLVFEV